MIISCTQCSAASKFSICDKCWRELLESEPRTPRVTKPKPDSCECHPDGDQHRAFCPARAA